MINQSSVDCKIFKFRGFEPGISINGNELCQVKPFKYIIVYLRVTISVYFYYACMRLCINGNERVMNPRRTRGIRRDYRALSNVDISRLVTSLDLTTFCLFIGDV